MFRKRRKKEVTIQLKVSWWFPYYVRGLIFFGRLHNCLPEDSKLRKMIGKALKVNIK
jgi:hypothetical protein